MERDASLREDLVKMSFGIPIDESLSLEAKMLLFQSDDRPLAC